MAKAKRKSFFVLAIKFIASAIMFIFEAILKILELLGRGIWLIIKYASIGIWKLVSLARGKKSKTGEKGEKGSNDKSEKKKGKRRSPALNKKAEFNPFDIVKTISGDYNTTHERMLKDSLITIVFGKRGSGKSALGFKILENIHSKSGRPCSVLGVSESVMPSWIDSIDDVESAENGSVVLVDEGAVAFSSRESMRSGNKELGKLLAIARHKNLSIVFITQNTGMIDKNVLKLADILMIKEGSLLQLEMERPEMKKFYEKATSAFAGLEGEKKKYVYVIDSDFEGVISHALPSFWSESISKNQAG